LYHYSTPIFASWASLWLNFFQALLLHFFLGTTRECCVFESNSKTFAPFYVKENWKSEKKYQFLKLPWIGESQEPSWPPDDLEDLGCITFSELVNRLREVDRRLEDARSHSDLVHWMLNLQNFKVKMINTFTVTLYQTTA